MEKRSIICFFALIALSLFLIGCQQEEYLLCPDNITKVMNLTSCPKETPKCPVCENKGNCTSAKCDVSTNYSCVYELVNPCVGNGICEPGEFNRSSDCISSCDDSNECTIDSYNYGKSICEHEKRIPCCGDKVCERGETYVICPTDCEQMVSLKISRYSKRQSIDGAYSDLTGTDFVYIIVSFKMQNLGFTSQETLNHKQETGFLYDPFKMRLEDENNRLYTPEYDSDLAEDWLDSTIIPKGDMVNAALIFIIPKYNEHLRLVAYDKYGNKLDIKEIY